MTLLNFLSFIDVICSSGQIKYIDESVCILKYMKVVSFLVLLLKYI